MQRTTTDDYQIWAHGFALTASLYHSRPVLAALVKSPDSTLESLCAATNANSGHLAIMLRSLSTIGWVTCTCARYRTTPNAVAVASCATLANLCADVYGELAQPAVTADDTSASAWGQHLPRLAKWLKSIEDGFALPAEAEALDKLGTMLAGAVIAPLLLELRMLSSSYTAKADEGKHEHASANVSLRGLEGGDATAAAVGRFFVYQKWGSYDTATQSLTLSSAVRWPCS